MNKSLFIMLFLLTATTTHVMGWGGIGFSLGSESYLKFGVTGGPGGMSFNGKSGATNKLGFTFGFDIDYTCFLNDFIGFTTGIHVNHMSSGCSDQYVKSAGKGNVQVSDGVSTWNYNARYHLITDQIDETYKTITIEVPILLSMQYRKWYWNLGVKVAVPVSMQVDYTYGHSDLYLDEIVGSGTVLSKPLQVASYDGASGSSDLYDKQRHQLLMFYVLASVEVGYTVAFYTGSSSLTVGLFGDFSLNSAQLNDASSSATITLNTNALDYHNTAQTDKVSSVGCYKAGIKLQYHLGIGRASQRSTRGLRYL